MRVLMLGWEFPPHISGGLGTACEGLSIGLARQNVEVIFVVPHVYGDEYAPHMLLMDCMGNTPKNSHPETGNLATLGKKFPGLRVKRVPAMLKPYLSGAGLADYLTMIREHRAEIFRLTSALDTGVEEEAFPKRESFHQYGWDIFAEVERFAANIVALFGNEHFDVVHAHDWMTYPAGLALARMTGKPLVVHVHSLEYDRSGDRINQGIFDIERLGVTSADAVVAVSYYTRKIVNQQHGVPNDRIWVVHNGVYPAGAVQSYRKGSRFQGKLVLFLGRVTFQKGPDYFVEAAARVVQHVPNVMFVLAGSGDMLPRLMDRVSELGVRDHFLFPGFLKGSEVEEMFSLADLYVMPSVSEPFGISALEAIKFETPVIISRQSGVSEVLSHALKVDFWDVNRLADLMINALIHEELRADMVAMAREEVRRLHWDAAAAKAAEVYNRVVS
ncbi:MAG: 4-alpha-glucanotransferase [Proteobacteria bacterium]|nr:MAG: 4-alpha-glucanotransferase [Pseudomonadota bacterium]